MKKKPKIFGPIDRPIIIIGEKMGRQRSGEDQYALEGNRTGDFIHEAIEGIDNLILTNVVNYYYAGNFDHTKHVGEGITDLIELFETYHPRKVICLGNISWDYTNSIRWVIENDCIVTKFPHPSWINRFRSSNRSEYIKLLRHELN